MARDCLGNELNEGNIVLFPAGDYMMAGVITLSYSNWRKHTARVSYPNPKGERWTAKYKNTKGLIVITEKQLDSFDQDSSLRIKAIKDFLKLRSTCLNQRS